MKLSLNWLQDYVTHNADADSLAHKLTMAGMEIESVEQVGSDTVFELEITPNRADCLSIMGLAREVSAIFDKTLKEPKVKVPTAKGRKIAISITEKKDCSLYLGKLIEGINVGQSSQHIQTRLNALGIRPISDLVDITNFCMMEYGQPLHVFDYDKLEGGCIEVRRARNGEKIVTLDGIERELDPSILIIADAKRPVAIAGIMGGKDTEVSATTKNVLLESAHIDPILIRRASRKLGLSSDSSYRFERGVDPAGVSSTADRAVQLILESAGGQVAGHGKAGSTTVKKNKAVALTLDGVSQAIGMSLTEAKIKKIFKKLNFEVQASSKIWKIIAPSSRRDIKDTVDLIEEVARVIGYDNIPEAMPIISENSVTSSIQRAQRSQLRELMLSMGFDEMVSFSLISREELKRAKINSEKVAAVINPLSLDQEILQPSTLPSLMNIAKANVNRDQKDLSLFEISKVYTDKGKEQEVLSVVMCGRPRQDWRDLKMKTVDIFDLKGVVQQALNRCGVTELQSELVDQDIYESNKGITMSLGKETLGHLGAVKKDILQNFGIKNVEIYYAQIAIPFKAMQHKGPRRFQPLSSYPAITRDVSLAVDQKVSYKNITQAIAQVGSGLLKNISFTEEYLGEKIPAGQRGLVFSLLYQSDERTLTEEEVNTVHQSILDKITASFAATLR